MKSSIDSFIGYSSSYVTSASSSIVVCPLRPQKGDSLSDPSSFDLQKFNSNLSIESPSHSRAIHRLILVTIAPLQVLKREIVSLIHVSSLVLQPRHPRHPLHRINFLKSLLESSISQSSMSLSPLQVLKRGIVSAYPIYAFILDPSPKHFVRIILVLSTSAHFIDVQDIRPRDSTPVFQPSAPFFFSEPRPSICCRIHATSRFKLTVITAFFVPILALLWNPSKNWLDVAQKGDR
jgi:hypothetical protein